MLFDELFHSFPTTIYFVLIKKTEVVEDVLPRNPNLSVACKDVPWVFVEP